MVEACCHETGTKLDQAPCVQDIAKSWCPITLIASPPIDIDLPRCPHCSKKCKNNSSLLKHMNNPLMKCIQFFEELV